MSKYSKGFAHIILLLVIVIVAIGGVGYLMYQNGQLSSHQLTALTPTPTKVVPANIVGSLIGWETYTNKEYHYKIDYPVNESEYPCKESLEEHPIETEGGKIVKIQPGRPCSEYFGIEVFQNPNNLSLFEYWQTTLEPNTDCDDELYNEIKCFTKKTFEGKNYTEEISARRFDLNGYNAILSHYTFALGITYPDIYVSNNNWIYKITSDNIDTKNPLSNEILSTFEFLDENQEGISLNTIESEEQKVKLIVPKYLDGTSEEKETYSITFPKVSSGSKYAITNDLNPKLIISDNLYELTLSIPKDGGSTPYKEIPPKTKIATKQFGEVFRIANPYLYRSASNPPPSDVTNLHIYTNEYDESCPQWSSEIYACALEQVRFTNPTSNLGTTYLAITCKVISEGGEKLCDSIVESLTLNQ